MFVTNILEMMQMNVVKTVVLGALTAGIMAGSAVSASAAIACTGNVCWHTHERYAYPRHAHVVIHEDTWHAGPTVVFHEHEGRGYWHGRTWDTW